MSANPKLTPEQYARLLRADIGPLTFPPGDKVNAVLSLRGLIRQVGGTANEVHWVITPAGRAALPERPAAGDSRGMDEGDEAGRLKAEDED